MRQKKMTLGYQYSNKISTAKRSRRNCIYFNNFEKADLVVINVHLKAIVIFFFCTCLIFRYKEKVNQHVVKVVGIHIQIICVFLQMCLITVLQNYPRFSKVYFNFEDQTRSYCFYNILRDLSIYTKKETNIGILHSLKV